MTTTTAPKTTFRSLLQTVIRAVVPKDDRFYDLLEEQARIGHLAAKKLAELSTGDLETVVAAVQELEHQGDATKERLELALASTFVTPIDREDIQMLSSELDDVLDYANTAARSCLIREVGKPTEPMIKLIALLGTTSEVVHQAVSKLRTHDFDEVTVLASKIRELESGGDRIYRDAIHALYRNPAVDAKRLRREEATLGDLEKALDHAEDLADTLINLAVKHG